MHRPVFGRGVHPGSELMAVALLLSGCMTWRPEPTRPADLIARRNPPVIRITQRDSSQTIVRNPEIQGDTLYGQPQKSLGDNSRIRTGFPLANILTIETRRSDGTKSVLLGAGIAVGTFSVMCLLAETFGCGEEPTFLVGDLGR